MSEPSQRKSAVVSGGNSGIGKAAATAIAKAGFDVTLVVRNAQRGEAARAELQAAVPEAQITVMQADLASPASVRDAVALYAKGQDRLDLLVNCAGVFLGTRQETADGVERTFATNVLGYYMLTHELLPLLKRGAPARIVNLASRYGRTKIDFGDLQMKTRKYTYFRAVAPTMVARVLFTQALADKLKGDKITVNAVHPGLVANTQLLGDVSGFFKWLTNAVGKTPEVGADTVVWLATAQEAANETGGLWAKRKRLKTPGQGSDPAARAQLMAEAEKLTGAAF